MDQIAQMLRGTIDDGELPGAVAMTGRPGAFNAVVVGVQDLATRTPMSRSSLFHWDSLGKPLTAALALTFVADDSIGLASRIDAWLPELADPQVLVHPRAELGETVPADRPVTLEDLLTLRGGLGFTTDFESPLVKALLADLQEGPTPRTLSRERFLAEAGELPLAHQPGHGWTYNLGSTLLGLLLERVGGAELDSLMAERIFAPLEMEDARWWVEAEDLDRFTGRYRTTDDPAEPLRLVDPPHGHFASPPVFPDGAGGIIGTVDDWLAFGEMLLGRGTSRGRRLLPAPLIDDMMTDQLTAAQRRDAGFFLEDDEGWGYGGSVRADGTYGWAGGAGVTARVDPRRGRLGILFTQVAMDGPQGSPTIARFDELVAEEAHRAGE